MYMVPVVICTRKDYAVSVYSTRERQTWTESKREGEGERESERESLREREIEREREGHANTYQYRITSESPCLVHEGAGPRD